MQVGIADRDMRVEAMSGGQRRKVAVASALIGSPDMLILDEPTNHMDVQARCFVTCGCVCPAAKGRCRMMSSACTLPMAARHCSDEQCTLCPGLAAQ